MDGSKLADYIGRRVTALMLSQAQLSITPGLKVEGTLIGIDQGAYIIKLDGSNDNAEISLIPIGQCRLNVH